MSAVGWVAVAFCAGYLWGKCERVVLAAIFGKEESVMAVLRRVMRHRTQVSTWAVVASLLFSIVVGVIVMLQKREDIDRTNCNTTFNRQSSLARDDRVAAQNIALQAQVEAVRQDRQYQHALRSQLHDPKATLETFTAVLNQRIDADTTVLHTLLHQQRVAAAHAYPPADLCEK